MTGIEWTDETWNPTVGCTRVSPGCDRCYAITSSRIRSANPHPAIAGAHAGATEVRDGRLDWTGQVNVLPNRLAKPLSWRKPRRIFVDSMSDLFHDQVPDEFIARVFAVMAATPRHTYQLLTKRHGRMRSLLSSGSFRGSIGAAIADLEVAAAGEPAPTITAEEADGATSAWPLPNVWLGVSVEDQQRADLRIPALLKTPATVRWLSCEPLLGPLDLAPWLSPNRACEQCDIDGCGCPWEKAVCLGEDMDLATGHQPVRTLDWVITGGESGSGARPMHPAWARALRDQCSAAAVPFFFKQWGDWAPSGRVGLGSNERSICVGTPVTDLGECTELVRVGKKVAGRELDGRTHDDFPLPEEASSRA